MEAKSRNPEGEVTGQGGDGWLFVGVVEKVKGSAYNYEGLKVYNQTCGGTVNNWCGGEG